MGFGAADDEFASGTDGVDGVGVNGADKFGTRGTGVIWGEYETVMKLLCG